MQANYIECTSAVPAPSPWQHQEAMVNAIAVPFTFCYCVTVVVAALTILISLVVRKKHIENMEECASGERENADDNRANVEISKAKNIEKSDDGGAQ